MQSSNSNKGHRTFRKLGVITIVAVFLLILVGGIVRSTGSGMGCPDWPKCFGSWVPPTDVSQLPPNYQEIYKHRGYADVAFNVYKTWIEYINRLLGAVIGILIFFTLVFSIPFLKGDKAIFYLSLITFILVGFQGWLGSVVVATNLAPWMVTLHMLVAILIVFILIYTVSRSYTGHLSLQPVANKASVNRILVFTLMLSLIQTLLGTQVREAVDVVAASVGDEQRHLWVKKLGTGFYIHRSFSAVVLVAHFYLLYLLKKNTEQKGLVYSYTLFLFAVVVAEIAAGTVMAYGGIPPFLQPVHLLLAVVAIGIQFLLLLFINYETVFLRASAQIESKKLSYK